ncbi:MAG: SdpI family protein [Candidatus Cloacimonetes bacterium]|nr:SdpI family protein [Candidatus Cloacimonadota bacterium]
MKRITNYWGSLILLFVYAVALIYFMTVLPSDTQIPMHWNARGEIDGYFGKTGAILFGLGFSFGLFLLLYLLPLYSPRHRKDEERFEKVLPAVTFVTILFFVLINLYSYLIALYGNVIPVNFIFVLIGLLFVFLGNLLPKVPRNFFIGIRTPWTLTDGENWHRTHRLGAYLFVLGGILMLLKAFVPYSARMFHTSSTILALVLVLYPLVYSFILFKRKRA